MVGAHAVAFHSKPRFTKDLDVLLEPSEENAARVLQALADFGFGSLDLTVRDLASAGRVIQLGFPPARIDLLTSIAGVSFEVAWAGRQQGAYGSTQVNYLGKAELIRNKRTVARPQDLMDLDWLEES